MSLKSIPVKSEKIRSVEYDAETLDMAVTFCSGSKWLFRNVPQDVVNQFTQSPSVGKAYDYLIKDKYPGEKIF